MLANGGTPAWRMRLRTAFKDYNALANGVLATLPVAMPEVDVSGVGAPPSGPPAGPGAIPTWSDRAQPPAP